MNFILGTFAAISVAGMVEVQDSMNCSMIRDTDRRAECRALTRNNRQDCSFIREHDDRYLCRAQTGRNPQECSFIRDNDRRAYCRAVTR